MQPTPMHRGLAPLAALALALSAGAARAQGGSPGAVDPARLAIELDSAESEPDLARLAARIGTGIRSARRFGPRSMRLLELDAPLADAAARERACRALAEEPGVRFATEVTADRLGLPAAPTRALLVRFLPAASPAEQRAVLSFFPTLRVAEERFGGMENAWKLESSARVGGDLRAQLAMLAELPIVKWAESDRVFGARKDHVPNDPLFPNSWALDNDGQQCADPVQIPGPPTEFVAGTSGLDMRLTEAWDLTTGSPGVIVVVLDDGVQQNHPDINQVAGMDFTGSGVGGGPINMCSNHGTAVAGCVTGLIDNAIGTAGVAPNCLVASAAVFADVVPCDGTGDVQVSWVISALDWAIGLGARVTTASIDMGAEDEALEDKYDEARDAGMIHFASSGNDPLGTVDTPEVYAPVNCVGGIFCEGTSFGTFGPVVDFVAPAVTIQTTDRTGANGYNTLPGTAGDYVTVSGTSFATPLTAGAAALVFARQPALSPGHVELVLEMSGRDLGSPGEDDVFAYGLVDVHQALELADEHVGDLLAGDYAFGGSFPIAFPPYYNSLAGAIGAVPAGGLVVLEEQNYPGPITITKALTLRRWDGVVTIGQ